MSKEEILMEIARLNRRIDMLVLLEHDAITNGPFDIWGMFTERICDYELEIIDLKRKII